MVKKKAERFYCGFREESEPRTKGASVNERAFVWFDGRLMRGNLQRSGCLCVELYMFVKKLLLLVTLGGISIGSVGCATALVRAEGGTNEYPIYPATTVDGLWTKEVVISGEHPLASPGKHRLNPLSRFVYGLGGLIDLPISLVTDSVLLPYDLYALMKSDSREEAE